MTPRADRVFWLVPESVGRALEPSLPHGWTIGSRPPGAGTSAAVDAAAGGCERLVFTAEARAELVPRLEQLVRASEETGAGLVAAEGASLSFAGRWSPRPAAGRRSSVSFPSPAAFVVDAAAYAAVGGIDDELGSLAEVDLAWRLALAGGRIHVDPSSGAASSAAWSAVAPHDLLAVLYKCLSDEWLGQVLPWSLALTLWNGEASRFGSVVAWAERIQSWRKKRSEVQSRRVVSDRDLLPLFPDPLAHGLPSGDEAMLAEELACELGLWDLVEAAPPARPAAPAASPSPSPVDVSRAHPVASRGRDGDGEVERDVEVSAIVVTATGPAHIEACLRSLAGQRFPRDRIEVIAVDNGSAVDPSRAIESSYPGACLLRLETNQGFTGGNNLAAAAAAGTWLAFLNDDVVVEPDWLAAMLDVARRRGAAAVAAPIYGWSGRSVDFASGAVSFEGKGFQLGHGRPRWLARISEAPVLFACGAGMLIRREVFAELGGFDEAFFAYYEDVSLGWKLWLRGHEVWLAPRAKVRHRQHASASLLTEDDRTKLYERNALSIVFTHLETRHRARALPASLLLLAKRALVNGAAPRAAALDAWMRELPVLRETRRSIADHRARGDRELLSRFSSRWTHPAVGGGSYRRYHDGIVDAFDLESIALPETSAGQRHRK